MTLDLLDREVERPVTYLCHIMAKNRTVRIVSWCLGTFLALAVLGEVGARKLVFLQLGNPLLYVTDPTIEYMARPNQDGWRFGNRFHINQWGMRSADLTASKTDKTEVRVLLIGDSVPFGGAQTDQDSLASEIVAREMTRAMNRKVTVANISAGSWGPPNQLAYLRKYGTFDADAVVILLSSHDYADWPLFTPLDPNIQPTDKPISALVEGLERYLPRYLPASISKGLLPTTETYSSQVNKASETLDSLSALIQFFLDQGIPVRVLHHWERRELEVHQAMPGRDSIDNRVRLAGLTLSSDSALFASSLQGGVNPYRDAIHPNTLGQRILARQVQDLLSDSSLSL